MVSGMSMVRTPREVQLPDKEKWEALRKGVDYTERALDPITGAPPPLGLGLWFEVLRILLLLVVAGVLIYLLVLLMHRAQLKAKSSAAEPAEDSPSPAPTVSEDFTWDAYNQAFKAGELAKCVQILYGLSLQQLWKAGMLPSRSALTPGEILAQVRAAEVRQPLRSLTAAHERHFYGDRVPTLAEVERSLQDALSIRAYLRPGEKKE